MATLIIGTVVKTERMPSSVKGNPRFQVTINMHPEQSWERQWPTAPDAGIAYEIENPAYHKQPHIFMLNGRGHIVGTFPLDEPGVMEYIRTALNLDRDTLISIQTVSRVIRGEL